MVQFAQVTSSCGTTRRPNPRTQRKGRSATSVAVRGTSSPHGPRSIRELRRLGLHKRSPCGGLTPPTPTSDQGASVDVRRPWTAPISIEASRHRGREWGRRTSSTDEHQHPHCGDGREGAERCAVYSEASKPGVIQASARRPRDHPHRRGGGRAGVETRAISVEASHARITEGVASTPTRPPPPRAPGRHTALQIGMACRAETRCQRPGTRTDPKSRSFTDPLLQGD